VAADFFRVFSIGRTPYGGAAGANLAGIAPGIWRRFQGPGAITGHVYKDQVAVPWAKVTLYDVETGLKAAVTTADGNGKYTFTLLEKGRHYAAMAHHEGYNAAVADWLTPA